MANKEFTNHVSIASTQVVQANGNDYYKVFGAFSCGIHTKKDSNDKPFYVEKIATKSNKERSVIACTLAFKPDNSINDKGYPFNSVYDPQSKTSKTLRQFLLDHGVQLVNDTTVYVKCRMNRGTTGLKALLGDPKLTYETNLILYGALTIYTAADGSVRVVANERDVVGLTHDLGKQVAPEEGNINCNLENNGNTGKTSAAAAAPTATSVGQFDEIDDDEEDLPF